MSLCHGMCYHTPGDDFVNKLCCHILARIVCFEGATPAFQS